ncbi:fimbrial protein [Variovorax sp. ZS18.2.2]|uniref:fimbrial protein n=1 Tax=Variovorax sp. ZS18.2.2 TaxID=2971255 RepID=UPI00215072E7|nr:fimbrial protein [Variovorax sp. ZS18.2.2]MCR6480125.1 fimbrial protein [Variovorax sp. ZS18.2.2]
MKKSAFIKFASLAVAGLLSQGAFAADGTINFTGEITDALCSVSPSSQNLTVPLGKVSRNVFGIRPAVGTTPAVNNATVGTKSTPAKFSIDLLGCGASATGATVTFTGPTDAVVATALRVGAGEVNGGFARGVAIELGDSSGKKIDVGSPSGEYILTPGDNSLKFQAAYVATLPGVTAGPANGSAQFTIAYK